MPAAPPQSKVAEGQRGDAPTEGGTARASGLLADPHNWALFLDIDGTLVEVAVTPDAVTVPRGLSELLSGLQAALGGALALVTGRQVAAADELLSPGRFSIAGVHGVELRTAPWEATRHLVPEVPMDLLRAVQEVAGRSSVIFVEHKRSGLAVHYRLAPAAKDELEAGLLRLLVDWPRYELRLGRMVLEVVPRGFSKASAIDALMQAPPFATRVPVAIGDDWGDECALASARQRGGLGLTVAGEHFEATNADFQGPTAVRAWLAQLLATLTKDRNAC